jgi:hypothetical protein
VDLGAVVPVRLVAIEAHEELQMTERSEAELVECADRKTVPSDGLDVDVRRPASTRFFDGGRDELSRYSMAAVVPIDDDGFDRGLLVPPEQS